MRSMIRFFEEGDKVKVTLRFRGREMAHQELGIKLLDRVKEDISKMAKVESDARFERPADGDDPGAALTPPPCGYPHRHGRERTASLCSPMSRPSTSST